MISTERTSNEYLVLNSCGIEHWDEFDGFCLREKGRVDYHILYVKEGLCHLTVNGEIQKIPDGNIIIFRPGQRQQYAYLKENKSISYYIHFTGAGCEHILDSLNFPTGYVTYIGKSKHFEVVFEQMAKEYSLKQAYHEHCLSGLLMQLLSVISRSNKIKESNIAGKNEETIEKACLKIYENTDTISIRELANSCYLSIGRFSHIFKEVTGKAPLKYISEMKLQKATDMLVNTNLPIGKIAIDAGYPDHNYFSRVFKKANGISPSVFRKNFIR